MPDQRTIRMIRSRHETVCRSPGCNVAIKPGDLVYWSQGGYVWCIRCQAPEMPTFDPTPEQADARFDAWCDRASEENHQRFMAGRAEREKGRDAGTSAGAGAIHPNDAPTVPAPAAVTSDERYNDAF